jgi:Flp pilus assembly pilin Flp
MDVFTEYTLLFVVAAPLVYATVAQLGAGRRRAHTAIAPAVADFTA